MAGKKKANQDRRKKHRVDAPARKGPKKGPKKSGGTSAAPVVIEMPKPAPVPAPTPANGAAAEPRTEPMPEVPVARERLSAMVPVRFEPQVLEVVKSRAAAEQRSVSSWIRRAVDHELERD